MTRWVAVALLGAAIGIAVVGQPASAKSNPKPKVQQTQTLCSSSDVIDTQRSDLEQQIRDLQSARRIQVPSSPQYVYPIVRCGPSSAREPVPQK
jgi:hypothetical protein